MGNKALGRDLGDLLSRARPSRLVDKVAPGSRPGAVPAPAPGALSPGEATPSAPSASADPASAEAPLTPTGSPLQPVADAGAVPSPVVPPSPAAMPAVAAEPAPAPGSRPFQSTAPSLGPESWPRVSVGGGVVCFLVDGALLAGAVLLMRAQPWSAAATTAAAVGLTVAGAVSALLGVACFRRRPVRTPRIGEGGTRIRVQLKQ